MRICKVTEAYVVSTDDEETTHLYIEALDFDSKKSKKQTKLDNLYMIATGTEKTPRREAAIRSLRKLIRIVIDCPHCSGKGFTVVKGEVDQYGFDVLKQCWLCCS